MPKNDELISLVDCQPENLVWVSGWYDAAHTKPTGWHLYQFGFATTWVWNSSYPSVMPPCRAPSFERANHNSWTHPEFSRFVPGRGSYWCHKCIVEIVMKFPHIFTGERK